MEIPDDPVPISPPVAHTGPTEDERHRKFQFDPILTSLAVLIVFLFFIQTGYLLSYGSQLRENQDALICQAQVTSILRANAGQQIESQLKYIDRPSVPLDKLTPEILREYDQAKAEYVESLKTNQRLRETLPKCDTPQAFH